MTPNLDAKFHGGNLAEQLGVLLLQGIAAVAPVVSVLALWRSRFRLSTQLFSSTQ
jgi:hypothetical protein